MKPREEKIKAGGGDDVKVLRRGGENLSQLTKTGLFSRY